ncbi:MAG: hypothetical protein ACE15F_14590 [bacterium]
MTGYPFGEEKSHIVAYWLFFAWLALLTAACASPRFVAQPSPGANIVADSTMSSVSQAGLAISVRQDATPIALGNRITTFRITLINQTDQPLEFIPKEWVLLTGEGRQFPALSQQAVAEAAAHGSYRGSSAGWSVGYGSYDSSNANAAFFQSSYPGGGRRASPGVLAQSLPLQPMTILPHATAEGLVYFAVAPRTLQSTRLRITRLSPGPNGTSVEIPYDFVFAVVK